MKDFHPNQLSFLVPGSLIPGSMAHLPGSLRAAISEMLRRSPKSRWEICGAMASLLDAEVPKSSLDDATSDAHQHRFPLEWLAPLMAVTGSLQPLELVADAVGAAMVRPEELHYLRLARLQAERKRLDERIKLLERERRQ